MELEVGNSRNSERGETRIICASGVVPAPCCLLLSNSLNRRSLAIAAQSPFICLTPCGTCWRSLSALGASYSTHIPYRPSLPCAPRRCPTVEPRQLLLPRPYALGLLQRIGGTASSPIHSEKRDHRLKATSPEQGDLQEPGRRSKADTQRALSIKATTPSIGSIPWFLAHRRCSRTFSAPVVPGH